MKCPMCNKFCNAIKDSKSDKAISDCCNAVLFYNKKDDVKPIFKNEEEAFIVLDDIVEVKSDNHDRVVQNSVKNAKEKGYIKKDPIEDIVEKSKSEISEIVDKGGVVYHKDRNFNKLFVKFGETDIIILVKNTASTEQVENYLKSKYEEVNNQGE